MDTRPHTLGYVRIATKAKDGQAGLLYIHHWATGYEHLIFRSKADADNYERKLNEHEKITTTPEGTEKAVPLFKD